LGLHRWKFSTCPAQQCITPPAPRLKSSAAAFAFRGFDFLTNRSPECKLTPRIPNENLSVDAEGKFIDNGIALSNKLGSNRVIVPVQVLGASDGPWDKNAWKTDWFYWESADGLYIAPQVDSAT